jgi:hypothetical protein
VLKGNALSWSDPAGNAEATALFERAIALDPDAARACVADCRVAKPNFTVAGCMAKEPLRRDEDAAHLALPLRLAGFPP